MHGIRRRGGPTHTFAILELSPAAYQEIATKLRAAGYDHAFDKEAHTGREVIDMHGIGIAPQAGQPPRVRCRFCRLTPDEAAGGACDSIVSSAHEWSQGDG